MCHLSYPQLLSTQLWACFNTEPNRLYRRLHLFPSKLQEYTPPPFSRLSTQYHIDPLLILITCLLSLDTSRTSLRLQRNTKFSNRHGRYEYSYNLANSRENWAPPKKSHPDTYIYVNIGIGVPIFTWNWASRMPIFGDAYIHLTPAQVHYRSGFDRRAKIKRRAVYSAILRTRTRSISHAPDIISPTPHERLASTIPLNNNVFYFTIWSVSLCSMFSFWSNFWSSVLKLA